MNVNYHDELEKRIVDNLRDVNLKLVELFRDAWKIREMEEEENYEFNLYNWKDFINELCKISEKVTELQGGEDDDDEEE